MSMPTRLRPVALTIGVSLVAGGSFVTTIRENTDAIGGSRAARDRQRGPGRRTTVIARRGL
jgi:hypothetical protein